MFRRPRLLRSARRPKPARVQKREAKRQQTLAERKAKAGPSSSPPSAPALGPPQTLLGLGRGLRSWSQCPAPLTAVVNRERDEHGQTHDWVLVSFTAAQIRSTYELRPAIEERHRQYKCFWDLTRMHSCANAKAFPTLPCSSGSTTLQCPPVSQGSPSV